MKKNEEYIEMMSIRLDKSNELTASERLNLNSQMNLEDTAIVLFAMGIHTLSRMDDTVLIRKLAESAIGHLKDMLPDSMQNGI